MKTITSDTQNHNNLTNHLLDKLKNLFEKEDLSDANLIIMESNNNHQSTAHSTESDETPPLGGKEVELDERATVLYCSFPIHSFVLSLQSRYFRSMLNESNMIESKEKEVRINVNPGEGLYMKHLVQSFYNHDLFDSFDPYTLLRIYELADRFSCDESIKRLEVLFESASITKFKNFEDVVQWSSPLESAGNIQKKLVTNCATNLTKLFCPLENKISKLHTFKDLSFKALLAVLQCRKPFTWHENSVLYFIALWLNYDPLRQNPENIKGLLMEVNFRRLTPEYMLDVITERHSLFNIWPEYSDWFLHVISYHAFSTKRARFGLCSVECNFDRDFLSEIQFNSWEFKMIESSDKNYKAATLFVFMGYELMIQLSFIVDDSLSTEYRMLLEVSCQNLRNIINEMVSDNEHLLQTSVIFGYIDGVEDSCLLHVDDVKKNMKSLRQFTCQVSGTKSEIMLGTVKKDEVNSLMQNDFFIALKLTTDSWPGVSRSTYNQESKISDVSSSPFKFPC